MPSFARWAQCRPSGNIVWQKEGLDARGEYDLEMEIRRQLGIR